MSFNDYHVDNDPTAKMNTEGHNPYDYKSLHKELVNRDAKIAMDVHNAISVAITKAFEDGKREVDLYPLFSKYKLSQSKIQKTIEGLEAARFSLSFSKSMNTSTSKYCIVDIYDSLTEKSDDSRF